MAFVSTHVVRGPHTFRESLFLLSNIMMFPLIAAFSAHHDVFGVCESIRTSATQRKAFEHLPFSRARLSTLGLPTKNDVALLTGHQCYFGSESSLYLLGCLRNSQWRGIIMKSSISMHYHHSSTCLQRGRCAAEDVLVLLIHFSNKKTWCTFHSKNVTSLMLKYTIVPSYFQHHIPRKEDISFST